MTDYPRFNQISHGFKQLTAVVVGSGGWRRAAPGERFHLIVARVYGPDTFAGIQIGEIDGLSDVVKGQFYGINGTGDLQPGLSPVVAIGCGSGTVVVIGDGEASASLDAATFEKLVNKGVPNGYVPLNSSGKIDPSYLSTSTDIEFKQRSWMGV